ncbi:MAG: DUF1559 domain-containing protein, partial [Thermoguttaceae bacterium]
LEGELPYARKYDIWDTYTWTQLILPHIGQMAVYEGYWTLPLQGYEERYPGPNGPIGNDKRMRASRHTFISSYTCTSDLSPSRNEWQKASFGFVRGNYRGCVGSGDMYGHSVDSSQGPWGVGAFSVLPGQSFDQWKKPATAGMRMTDFIDGVSNTILLSEGIVPTTEGRWGGPLGETIYGNMGGALFSAALTPNSSAADQLYGPCPQMLGDSSYEAPCVMIAGNKWWKPTAEKAHAAARSKHPEGVNVAMVDGSVTFVADRIDQHVWRALATRAEQELVSLPE